MFGSAATKNVSHMQVGHLYVLHDVKSTNVHVEVQTGDVTRSVKNRSILSFEAKLVKVLDASEFLLMVKKL